MKFVFSNELNRSSSSRAFPDKNKDEWTDKWNICHSNSEITVAEENILFDVVFFFSHFILYFAFPRCCEERNKEMKENDSLKANDFFFFFLKKS